MILICNDCGNKGKDEDDAFGFIQCGYDKPFEPAPRKCLKCGSYNCRQRHREIFADYLAFGVMIIMFGILILPALAIVKLFEGIYKVIRKPQ